jgi:dTDP-4-dehydrorhamnose reductase
MIPELFENETQLLEHFTTPDASLGKVARSIDGPLVVLGAGGKMGPTLCVLAKRAMEEAGVDHPVIAVSRFSNPNERAWLEGQGVSTHTADLLDPKIYASLPDAHNVIYLVGLKFGTQQNPELTWAVNTVVPMQACRRYAGARMVALSTGNVYPMSQVSSGGSVETDPLTPLGEYANAAVARERVLGYVAAESNVTLAIMRLNYAQDLRYGVLVDLATKIWNNESVDVSMGYFNAIWQKDANMAILRTLDLVANPKSVWNLTGPDVLSVRSVALALAKELGRQCQLKGAEGETALLSNASALWDRLDADLTPVSDVIRWIAAWVKRGGRLYGKPTKFEVRDGQY